MENSVNTSRNNVITPSRRLANWWNRVEVGRRGLAFFSLANSVRLSQRLGRLSQDHHFNRQTPQSIPEDEPMEMRIGDQFDIKFPEQKGSNPLVALLLALAFGAAGAGITWGIMKDSNPSPEQQPPVINMPNTDTDTDTTYDVILR